MEKVILAMIIWKSKNGFYEFCIPYIVENYEIHS